MRAGVALCLAALLLTAGAAWAVDVGIGVFGGPSYPALMQDSGRGSTFGVRVPVDLGVFFTLEPYFQSYKMGEGKRTLDDGTVFTRAAFDGTSFGANVILGSPMGTGFKFFPYGGIGTTKLTRPASVDLSEVSYMFGLGLGAGFTPKISLIARGDFNMVKTGDTSRKMVNATVGLTYNLFSSPSAPSLLRGPKPLGSDAPEGRNP